MDMDVEKKRRRAEVERMRNKDKRNTPEVETYCRGERSQDAPSGYGVWVRALVGAGLVAGSIGMIGVGQVQ